MVLSGADYSREYGDCKMQEIRDKLEDLRTRVAAALVHL